MKAAIYFEHINCGLHVVDKITLRADTLEELQALAAAEVEKRQPDNYWSEEVT